MSRTPLMLMGLLVVLIPVSLNAQERMLFQFDSPKDVRPWRSVNDGVMGGRSSGQVSYDSDGSMDFSGYLSLENNGGFASIRAAKPNMGLRENDVIFARVRGDGRKYTFNVYAQENLRGRSYRQTFPTTKDKWTVVAFPVNQFAATWRGRNFPNDRLDPAQAAGLGILLGDKKQGPFNLEIDWIKVVGSGVGK